MGQEFRREIVTTRARAMAVVRRKQGGIRRKDDRAFTKVAVAPGESVINNGRTLDPLWSSLFDAPYPPSLAPLLFARRSTDIGVAPHPAGLRGVQLGLRLARHE